MCTNWKEGGNCVQFGVKSEQVLLDERGGDLFTFLYGQFSCETLPKIVTVICYNFMSSLRFTCFYDKIKSDEKE